MRRSPRLLLLLAVALSAPSARGQEAPEIPQRDLRPPAAAYTVLDGERIPGALRGLSGDAARGEALFFDLETGGCTACHAVPGRPRAEAAPRILRDRLPELPPPAPEPVEDEHGDLAPDALEGEGGSDSDSALAPEEARTPPPPRPAQTGAAASQPAAASAEAAPEPDRPPLLPLPPGPDLAGAADRLTPGRLRLWVVNPRIADPGARMPAYHDVSLTLARRNPDLRQPWLSPQEVEDVVAYLLTLGEADEPPPHGDVTTGDEPPR